MFWRSPWMMDSHRLTQSLRNWSLVRNVIICLVQQNCILGQQRQWMDPPMVPLAEIVWPSHIMSSVWTEQCRCFYTSQTLSLHLFSCSEFISSLPLIIRSLMWCWQVKDVNVANTNEAGSLQRSIKSMCYKSCELLPTMIAAGMKWLPGSKVQHIALAEAWGLPDCKVYSGKVSGASHVNLSAPTTNSKRWDLHFKHVSTGTILLLFCWLFRRNQ